MHKIQIRYGCESISKDFPHNTTIGQVVKDPNIKAVLGFGDNVKALVNGVEMPMEAVIPQGGTLTIETAANSKAQN